MLPGYFCLRNVYVMNYFYTDFVLCYSAHAPESLLNLVSMQAVELCLSSNYADFAVFNFLTSQLPPG